MTGRRFDALGSCKWSRHADSHDLARLAAHRDAIRGAGTARLYMFARGFASDLVRQAQAGEVTLVSLEDLFI